MLPSVWMIASKFACKTTATFQGRLALIKLSLSECTSMSGL